MNTRALLATLTTATIAGSCAYTLLSARLELRGEDALVKERSQRFRLRATKVASEPTPRKVAEANVR
jgi:hypothetical protein